MSQVAHPKSPSIAAATRTDSAAVRSGVNVAGYLRTESGVGQASRGYVQALRSLGVPISLRDLSCLSGNRAQDENLTEFDKRLPYDTNLICADIEPLFGLIGELGDAFFDRYNVGIWAWELPRFPEKWYDRFAYYDEIWVATSFIANVLSPISPIPIVRIPPVLAAAEGSREAGRARLGAADDETVFLFVFDVNSHLARKNPFAAIEAFKQAFRPSDSARLVLKCVNGASDREGFAKLTSMDAGARIEIHNGYCPAAHVHDLMAACDVYVSLHRSEGTGLTITDAMSLGKPVIATGWSGNMDFMSVSNSFPVRYELVELQESCGPYKKGETWAEPSVAHAAEMMRQAFIDRALAAKLGAAAKKDLAAAASEEAVAKLIEQRLKAIGDRKRLKEYRSENQSRYFGYRAMITHLQDTVHRVTPPGAVVAVVSKGDTELVDHPGRTAWHFPQAESGVYAGHYPSDSSAAITHLEALRAKGAQFLVIPESSGWWLDHYREFASHLDGRYSRIHADEQCIVYRL